MGVWHNTGQTRGWSWFTATKPVRAYLYGQPPLYHLSVPNIPYQGGLSRWANFWVDGKLVDTGLHKKKASIALVDKCLGKPERGKRRHFESSNLCLGVVELSQSGGLCSSYCLIWKIYFPILLSPLMGVIYRADTTQVSPPIWPGSTPLPARHIAPSIICSFCSEDRVTVHVHLRWLPLVDLHR